MTYAIVETGGKQLWVEPGRFYDVERLPETDEDSALDLSQVLLVNHEGQVTLGHPYVSEAVVKARILHHRRGTKVIVYKMRPKKKTRKKKGHRQELTRVLIEAIELNGVALATAKPVAEPTSLVEATGGIPEDAE
ncbi:MAG: 50S ribosomal protein L21 [Cyanobacteriota bacterium]